MEVVYLFKTRLGNTAKSQGFIFGQKMDKRGTEKNTYHKMHLILRTEENAYLKCEEMKFLYCPHDSALYQICHLGTK